MVHQRSRVMAVAGGLGHQPILGGANLEAGRLTHAAEAAQARLDCGSQMDPACEIGGLHCLRGLLLEKARHEFT